MKYRDLTKALRSAGCVWLRHGKGDHEVWGCPCGKHTAVVPIKTEITPGVLRGIVSTLECLEKGWLR